MNRKTRLADQQAKGTSLRNLLGTIRVRLTLWNSLLVLSATFLALFVAREGMKYGLIQETRELLREELTELDLAVGQWHPDRDRIVGEFERRVLSHSRHDWFARLIDRESGRTVWQSKNYPPQFDVVDKSNLTSFSFQRTKDLIVSSHPVDTGDGRKFLIVLGEPTAFIKRDVWKLTKIILMIGSVMLLVAPIGGYFLARNAMRPVREIIATTRSLEPSRLESRLPLRGTGDELDQISAEINSFVDLISVYLTGQRDFIANAAHELRSPLTAIQTSVEVCLTKPRTSEDYRDQLETVSEQCQSLRHLVNQLLELAETDVAMNFSQTELDFAELVNRSISVFSGVADEKGVQVVVNLEPQATCVGDPTKLMQVVNNLVDNAIKFTPTGGLITVGLARNQEGLRLTIEDNGPGVPPLALDKIFDRFYQTDASRYGEFQHGNGLGLSICKSIIELHGGLITAENVDPHGLKMGVEIKV